MTSFFNLHKEDKEERDKLLEKLDRMTEQLLTLNENLRSQAKVIEELRQTPSERDALIEKLRKEIVALK